MIFEKIELENYRQYKKETIELALPAKATQFTIIEGANGAGKTNLLNAITWCLYEEEMDLSDADRGKPIVNDLSLDEIKDGEICNVRIKITARDEDNKKMFFEREARYEKRGDNAILTDFHPKSSRKHGIYFQVGKMINNDIVLVDDPEYTVLRIFPKRICKYFFFNGEKLDEYFKGHGNEKIKDEVFNISQLHLFEKVYDHLSKCRDSYSRDIKGASPDADRVKKELDETNKALSEHEDNLGSLLTKRKKADSLLDEFNKKLRDSSSSQVKRLQKDRDDLELDLNRLESGLKDLEQERLDFFVDMMPPILLHKAIKQSNEVLNNKVDSGEIPPKFKKTYLEGLLLKGKCICGTDVSKKNPDARKKVENILKESVLIDELTKEVIDDAHELKDLLNEITNFREEQKNSSRKINDLESQTKEKNKKLKKISDEIKGVDVEQIERIERQREIAAAKRDEIIGEITLCKAEIDRLKDARKELENDYERELKKISKNEKLKKILLFCEQTLKVTDEIKEKIMEETRFQIEKETKKQFFELIWKKKSFKDVKIDKNYNISVIDNRNMEVIGSLSAGERQVLALSFMSALNIASGFDTPLVIDTPLGRISGEPGENIASNLPSYLKGKQVLLLVTDVEYRKGVRDRLRKSVGKEYKISFIEKPKGCEAKVVQYEK